MGVELHSPSISDEEKERLLEVLESGNLKGSGEYDQKCADLLESEFRVEKAMMTTSCTHALEMAAMLLDIEEGDEIILPSYTFPATATAFILHGADPVFVDIKPDTLNMDSEEVRAAVTEDTAAIVLVHYAGIGCDMEAIMDIADSRDIRVVEDAAQAAGASYDGEWLGTIGDIGTFSFHETKNFVAGEGGAILLNDESYIERAEMIRQNGTNYEKFARGEVEHYTWTDIGSSYVPSELQTALAYTQLQKRDELTGERRDVHERYMQELRPLADDGHIQLPTIPEDRTSNYHIFWILTESREEREKLSNFLGNRDIEAYGHYRPLHTSKMGQKFGYTAGDLPVTEKVADTILRLPIHGNMSDEDTDKVVQGIEKFYS